MNYRSIFSKIKLKQLFYRPQSPQNSEIEDYNRIAHWQGYVDEIKELNKTLYLKANPGKDVLSGYNKSFIYQMIKDFENGVVKASKLYDTMSEQLISIGVKEFGSEMEMLKSLNEKKWIKLTRNKDGKDTRLEVTTDNALFLWASWGNLSSLGRIEFKGDMYTFTEEGYKELNDALSEDEEAYALSMEFGFFHNDNYMKMLNDVSKYLNGFGIMSMNFVNKIPMTEHSAESLTEIANQSISRIFRSLTQFHSSTLVLEWNGIYKNAKWHIFVLSFLIHMTKPLDAIVKSYNYQRSRDAMKYSGVTNYADRILHLIKLGIEETLVPRKR